MGSTQLQELSIAARAASLVGQDNVFSICKGFLALLGALGNTAATHSRLQAQADPTDGLQSWPVFFQPCRTLRNREGLEHHVLDPQLKKRMGDSTL